jgi:hypothetical protein
MLSPYRDRRWQPGDQQRLAEIARPLAQILQRNWQIAAAQDELAQTRQSLQSAQDRMLKAETDRASLMELVSVLQAGPGSDRPASSSQDSGDGLADLPNPDPALKNSIAESSPQSGLNTGGEGSGRDWEHQPSTGEGNQRE